MTEPYPDDEDKKRLLAAAPAPAPADEALRQRILAIPELYPRRRKPAGLPPRPGFRLHGSVLAAQAAGLAAAAVLGLWAGMQAGAPEVDISDWAAVAPPEAYERGLE